MTAQHDLDRQLEAFLRDGPAELPDASFDAVRDHIEGTHQRAAIGPWRMTHIMNRYVPIGIGAAAVAVAVVVGAQVFGSRAPGDAGATPPSATPPPTAAPSPSPTAPASPSASTAAPTALNQAFTSDRNGFAIAHPAGWLTKPATTPWTSNIPSFYSADGDVLYHPTLEDGLWIVVASQPLGGKAGEEWVDDLVAEGGSTGECGAPGDPVTVDGAQGRWCGDNVVAVVSGDRGYAIRLYTTDDDPAIGATYDRAWLEEVLATVRLRPDDALDATLTEAFTSDRNGFAIAHPAGWLTHPATEPWTSNIPDFYSKDGDVLYHPALEDHLWIAAASRSLDGKAGEQWLDELLAEGEATGECGPAGDAVTIDGAQGRWCGDNAVAIASGDRGYVIRLYVSGDDPSVGATYDRAWLEEVLTTVRLQP